MMQRMWTVEGTVRWEAASLNVYLNGKLVGLASTWSEALALAVPQA